MVVVDPRSHAGSQMPGEADRIPTGLGNHALMKYPGKEACTPTHEIHEFRVSTDTPQHETRCTKHRHDTRRVLATSLGV